MVVAASSLALGSWNAQRRARAVAGDDVATVHRWITRAARAATLDEVFAD